MGCLGVLGVRTAGPQAVLAPACSDDSVRGHVPTTEAATAKAPEATTTAPACRQTQNL